jgi:hypothetical protein
MYALTLIVCRHGGVLPANAVTIQSRDSVFIQRENSSKQYTKPELLGHSVLGLAMTLSTSSGGKYNTQYTWRCPAMVCGKAFMR